MKTVIDNTRRIAMGARFVKKSVRGENAGEGNDELFKLVIDTDEVSGELLTEGVSREIAEQLEGEVSDLLEEIGQSGSVEVVEVGGTADDDEGAEGESARKTARKTFGEDKAKKAVSISKLLARIADKELRDEIKAALNAK